MTYRRARHLAWRKVVDETVVVDLRRGRVFSLNDAGAWVLSGFARGRAVEEIAATLAKSGDEERIKETEAFVAELAGHGLLEGCSEVSDSGERIVEESCPAFDAAPRILWHEKLQTVTHQASPPLEIGNPACIQ